MTRSARRIALAAAVIASLAPAAQASALTPTAGADTPQAMAKNSSAVVSLGKLGGR
jgi:hypothetical protein